jgi:hypothetical protein
MVRRRRANNPKWHCGPDAADCTFETAGVVNRPIKHTYLSTMGLHQTEVRETVPVTGFLWEWGEEYLGIHCRPAA